MWSVQWTAHDRCVAGTLAPPKITRYNMMRMIKFIAKQSITARYLSERHGACVCVCEQIGDGSLLIQVLYRRQSSDADVSDDKEHWSWSPIFCWPHRWMCAHRNHVHFVSISEFGVRETAAYRFSEQSASIY